MPSICFETCRLNCHYHLLSNDTPTFNDHNVVGLPSVYNVASNEQWITTTCPHAIWVSGGSETINRVFLAVIILGVVDECHTDSDSDPSIWFVILEVKPSAWRLVTNLSIVLTRETWTHCIATLWKGQKCLRLTVPNLALPQDHCTMCSCCYTNRPTVLDLHSKCLTPEYDIVPWKPDAQKRLSTKCVYSSSC